MHLRRISPITIFYLFAFLQEFMLIYPLYTLFFADHRVSPGDIALLLIVWSVTAFVLEIPSGAVADKFDRRHVLIAAQFLKALALVVWLTLPTFQGFLMGFILWGMESALTSGTKEALVYDELARANRAGHYAKVIGQMGALSLAGVTAASFLASALAGHGYTIILIASISVTILSGMVLLLLQKAPAKEEAAENGYLQYLMGGTKEVITKSNVLLITIFLALLATFVASDEFYSLLFREKGLANNEVAFWEGVEAGLVILGSLIAHKFEHRRFRLELLVLLAALCLVGAGLSRHYYATSLIGLFGMLMQIATVIYGARLQHNVSDRVRATATSVGGFLSEIGAMATFTFFGFMGTHTTYANGLKLFGVILASFVVVYVGLLQMVRIKKRIPTE